MDDFEAEGKAAGFTPAQLKFLDEWFPGVEHTHQIEDVEGLEEALDGDEPGDAGDPD